MQSNTFSCSVSVVVLIFLKYLELHLFGLIPTLHFFLFQLALHWQKMAPEKKRSPRLHVDGAILGYKRALRTQNPTVSLIKIKGCDNKADTEFYLGKRIAFVTKAQDGSFRVNWGKVCRAHGSNGVVRCRFRRNLPPQSIGGRVRVMLYPSRI